MDLSNVEIPLKVSYVETFVLNDWEVMLENMFLSKQFCIQYKWQF